MNSNNRCIRRALRVFRARKYSSGHKACMLALTKDADRKMNRSINHLCLFAACLFATSNQTAGGAERPQDPVQASAKLAEIRSRIVALTDRLHEDLKSRDAASARLREAEVGMAGTRRRLEDLRSAERAALKRRVELQGEERYAEAALDAGRTALAAQVRTAYMLGRQERIKLLLNQSDPAAAGRMAALHGYLVRARAQKIDDIRE